MAQQPLIGHDLLIIEASRSHSDTPHSVGLLWTSDQLVAETSTLQRTTLTTDTHAPGGIRTHNPIKRAAADLRLRPRGYWDRPTLILLKYYTNNSLLYDNTCSYMFRSFEDHLQGAKKFLINESQ